MGKTPTQVKHCTEHTKQLNKFYCTDCSKSICIDCVLDHSKHELKKLAGLASELVSPWKVLNKKLGSLLAKVTAI